MYKNSHFQLKSTEIPRCMALSGRHIALVSFFSPSTGGSTRRAREALSSPSTGGSTRRGREALSSPSIGGSTRRGREALSSPSIGGSARRAREAKPNQPGDAWLVYLYFSFSRISFITVPLLGRFAPYVCKHPFLSYIRKNGIAFTFNASPRLLSLSSN